MAKKKAQEEEVDEIEWDDDEEEAPPQSLAITNVDGVELPMAWGMQSSALVDEVRKHRQMFNMKHGMFAQVPMVCKGGDCPLFATCTIHPKTQPVGQRCPIEIAAILDRFDKYCSEIGVQSDEFFAQSQVKDLVDIEIKLMRANGMLAISGDFIEEVVAAIDNKGNVHYRPELHKATEYEEKLLKQKGKILNDLYATRRNKNQNNNTSDPSSFASDLMRRAMKAQAGMSVDADFEMVEDVNSDNTEEVGEE